MTRLDKLTPRTLAEHNNSVMNSSDILTGKQFRNKRRKKLKKTYIKFGSLKTIVYL